MSSREHLKCALSESIEQLVSRESRFEQLIKQSPEITQKLFDVFSHYEDVNSCEPTHDEIIYHLQFWLHHFIDFGLEPNLRWDDAKQSIYPFKFSDLTQQIVGTYNTCVTNKDEIIEKLQPLVKLIDDNKGQSSFRILCNHPTWFTNGAIVISLALAYQKYLNDYSLVFLEKFLENIYVLIGPAITTIHQPFVRHNNKDYFTLDALLSISNAIKVIPMTENARLSEIKRFRANLNRAYRESSQQLTQQAGSIRIEAIAGRIDLQKDGCLQMPALHSKSLDYKDTEAKLLLMGIDERDIFCGGHVKEGYFVGGELKPGRINLSFEDDFINTSKIENHHEIGQRMMNLLKDKNGNTIGVYNTEA